MDGYEYPFCATDLTYYTGNPVVTTSPTVSYGPDTCGDKTYRDANYDECLLVWPGYLSPSK